MIPQVNIPRFLPVTFCNCRLAGANFNPGTIILKAVSLGAMLTPLSTLLALQPHLLQSHSLSVSLMSLVSQPGPSACPDEQHNAEVQDKIYTEPDDETQ